MDDRILAHLTRQLQAKNKIAETGNFEAHYPLNLELHDFIVMTAATRP